MTGTTLLDAYGTLTEPTTLTIRRLLPGPIKRVWAYLTESELRRQWLAAGEMEGRPGAAVELVWRNDNLSDAPSRRPADFPAEHRLACEVTEFEPPHRLAITWGSTGGVTFELERQGSQVLLTVTHRRVPERAMLLNVSAGWHAHLDVLAARMEGRQPGPFWEAWAALKADYTTRFTA